MKLLPDWLKIRHVFAGVFTVFWFGIISLPVFGLMLAMQGELVWSPNEYREYRVWLIMEDDERGLGWTTKGPFSRTADQVCSTNRVGFVFWRGDTEQVNTDYCECYSYDSGTLNEYVGKCDSLENFLE